MRRAFANGLLQAAAENPRVAFLTGDLGFQVFDEFRERYGARYVNVGVAEAQLICAAAGLALEGWRPVCYSIASFLTGRAFEPIRVSIGYPRLPVMLVGAGGGYAYASSGVTHHAAEDLALMASLPDMTVVAPGSPEEVTQLLPQMFQLPGPSYLRIGKFGEATYAAEEPAQLGRARLLRNGERVALICTGNVTPAVLDGVVRLNADGHFPSVYQFHTVKPLDVETLERLARRVEAIVVVEESLPTGGLYQAIAAWKAQSGSLARLLRLGPPDALALGAFRRETLQRRFGYDAEAVYATCQSLWERPKLTLLAA